MVPHRSARTRIRATAFLAALLLGLQAALAQVEEVKPKPPEQPPEKAEPKNKEKEKEKAPEPPAVIQPTDPEDGRRIEALLLRLSEWESNSAERTVAGLKVRAVLVPDAIAYQVVMAYLDRRRRGDDHPRALAMVSRNLPRWKRFEKQGQIVIELENPTPKLGGEDRRIYTLEAQNAAKQVTVTDEKKRRLPVRYGGQPRGLRRTSLRIQKFWVTADGVTRRPQNPGDPSRSDPASIGRKPLVSKPFEAYVLEEKPAQIDLLLSRQIIERTGSREFRVAISQWKKYEGPFEKDRLDLNLGRTWDEVADVDLLVSLPPAGLQTSQELQDLVTEVRAAGERRAE